MSRLQGRYRAAGPCCTAGPSGYELVECLACKVFGRLLLLSKGNRREELALRSCMHAIVCVTPSMAMTNGVLILDLVPAGSGLIIR